MNKEDEKNSEFRIVYNTEFTRWKKETDYAVLSAQQLWRIYRLARFLKLDYLVESFGTPIFLKRIDFMNTFHNNLEDAWERLYKRDQEKIANNDLDNFNISYFNNRPCVGKFVTVNQFGKNLLYHFKIHIPEASIFVSPECSEIQIKNIKSGATKFSMISSNMRKWIINFSNNFEELYIADYCRMLEFIYCLSEGEYISKIPDMPIALFRKKFKDVDYFGALNFYKIDNIDEFEAFKFNHKEDYFQYNISNGLDKNIFFLALQDLLNDEKNKEVKNMDKISDFLTTRLFIALELRLRLINRFSKTKGISSINRQLNDCINLLNSYFDMPIPEDKNDPRYEKWDNFINSQLRNVKKYYPNVFRVWSDPYERQIYLGVKRENNIKICDIL